MHKIGIIGLGHMGQAMLNGFKKNNFQKNVIGYHYDQQKANELGQKLNIEVVSDYQKFIDQGTVIIIAVVPDKVDNVIESLKHFDLKSKTFISIVSGMTIAQLAQKFVQKTMIVRALPNLNAAVGMSATGVQFMESMDVNLKNSVLEILNQFGKTYEISEEQFSVFTVISGCTPAYFFKITDAIYQSGIKNGLSDELALEIAQQSGIGSLTTLVETNSKPKALVDAVCVPNGITIEGINYLNEQKFDEMIDQAIKKSIEKDLKGHGN